MTIIFKAKTSDAYHIKILAELLTNNIKVAHFEIDQRAIRLCMMDNHRKILIDLELLSENFSLYKLKKDKMYLGVNLSHFHKMLKSIKKKDSLELYINDENPTKLGIKVVPKENNRITTSYVTIQVVQELEIDIPTGYNKPVIISATEFQKMVKDMDKIGNVINIKAKNFYIQFNCETGGILERTVEFGELDDDCENEEFLYDQDFDTEQLSRITKLSGLSSQIKIFAGKPILFNSKIGNIGEISLYIKSKEQMDEENYNLADEYDSE